MALRNEDVLTPEPSLELKQVLQKQIMSEAVVHQLELKTHAVTLLKRLSKSLSVSRRGQELCTVLESLFPP